MDSHRNHAGRTVERDARRRRASFGHLLWIPLGATVGFLASFIFGDLLTLPVDLYYLIYFTITISFFVIYVVRTKLPLRTCLSKRWKWGVVLGILVGLVMMQNVLARPVTEQFSGLTLAGAILWRGVIYGAVDGLLLFTFPWIVVWRAISAEERTLGVKLRAGALAWLAILLITTTYHLGYADFRSEKIVQPNIGNTIMAVPTLVTASPIASPITHVFLHVTAVVHSPRTDLFLPPHRETAENTSLEVRSFDSVFTVAASNCSANKAASGITLPRLRTRGLKNP